MSPPLDIVSLRDAVHTLGFNDYLRQLPLVQQVPAARTPVRLAVLRSYTCEPIEPVLKLRLLLEGRDPSFWFGGYNQYAQEILDRGSALYRFAPQIVLLLVRLDEVLPAFIDDYAGTPYTAWEQQMTQAARDLAALAERAVSGLSAIVILQNASLAEQPSLGVFDAQHAQGQGQLVHAFNQTLAGALSDVAGAFVWDFDGFARQVGHATLSDPKAWYVSRNPYKQSAYPSLTADLFRYVRAALGDVKKCIVLDLDNTLWGGLAGEEGLEGVALGQTYPGNCFRDFQKALLRLHRRGILLAINSKNNESDALRIIDNHPDMILRREHFAAMRINWEDKAANLESIARELNIGIESMVFLDDNPAECQRIRQACAGCDVVLVPHKPYLIPALAATLPGIDNILVTDEDRRKAEMYRAQAARRAFEQQHGSVEDFLRSLDMEASIERATPFSIPRIAQLTQKTNQMNMTSRRYSEAEIAAFAADPECGVFSVAAKDRFGDHGIVGVLILRRREASCTIDTFLLSCRIIGRGIEETLVAFAAREAADHNATTLLGEFFATAKNRPAAGFYERVGFTRLDDSRFAADLARTSFAYPPHLRVRAATSRNGASAAM